MCDVILAISVAATFGAVKLVPSEYATIQEAIDAAADDDTVLVDEGTYFERIDFSGNDIVVTSQYLFTGDSATIVNTVIDADHGGSCVTMTTGETEAAVLMGFTLQNGTGSLYEPAYGSFYVGGGVYLIGSSPLIQNNVIKDNVTPDGGGGIFSDGGVPFIQYNTIVENETAASSGCGAGILIKNADGGEIAHNYIQFNQALHGGGIAVKNSSPYITRNVITDNVGITEAGGIWIYDGATPSIVNNTISGNSAPAEYGGGVLVQDGSAPVFMNNIISFTESGGGFIVIGDCTPELSYNLCFENSGGDYINCGPGIGAITGDPAYVGGDPHDYHLTESSAAIDVGNPVITYNDPDGTRNDVGAFYYEQIIPLPVELTSFTAETTTNGVMLTWHTASELNCYEWIIQRDGVNVASLPGHGTTVIPQVYSYLDPVGDGSYTYQLKEVDIGGAVSYSGSVTVNVGSSQVADFILLQNYPNPFNPETAIVFTLPETRPVRLSVHNSAGALIKILVDGSRNAGAHSIIWAAEDLPSGVYICRLETGAQSVSKTVILMK
jgi:parallel beta-helix repeat protein